MEQVQLFVDSAGCSTRYDTSRGEKRQHGEEFMTLDAVQPIASQLGYADTSQVPASIVNEATAPAIVKEIARRRARVVVPLFLSSFATYVATLLALSYFPNLVAYKIFGAINLAYVLALAQFAITFLTAFAYALWARRAIDPLVASAFVLLERSPMIGGIR
jgi:uncharacterized membrane protein (DUF485 family)